jgi:periplasmic protein TonB
MVIWVALSGLLHAGVGVVVGGTPNAHLAAGEPDDAIIFQAGDGEVAAAAASEQVAALPPRPTAKAPRRAHPPVAVASSPLPAPPPPVTVPASAIEEEEAAPVDPEPAPPALAGEPPPGPAPAAEPPPPLPLPLPVAADPAPPPHVPPGVAKALRVYDTFPRLPEPMRAAGAAYVVMVDVCVSHQGDVSDVTIEQGAPAPLDRALRAAIRTWRYRPFLVAGTPTPFCHLVQIDYRM